MKVQVAETSALYVGNILLAILLLSNHVYTRLVARPDPREGVLDASLVLIVRQTERDTFSAEEVFLGEAQAGDLIRLPDFRLITEQEKGSDLIDPITPDTRVLLFLKQNNDGREITQNKHCFFWVQNLGQVDELRARAHQAVRLRRSWEKALAIPDQERRVEMLWPYLWGHGVSFQKRTQTELQKTGSIAGNYIAEHLASLNHGERMTLLPDLGQYGGERLHAALRKHLLDQEKLYEQFAAADDLASIFEVKDWNRLSDELKAAYGELYYGLAGLAGFKDQSDLPFVRGLAEWAVEKGCWQVCEAALQAFRYVPERENLPVISTIWKRFGTQPPDGHGIKASDITRTLRTHLYSETVPLLAQFLGDKNVASEARGCLGEIVGQDLGPDARGWTDWYARRKDQDK